MCSTNLGKGVAEVMLGFVDVVGVGYVRKHGASKRSGLPRYEVCLNNDYPTTPIIKDAAERGAIVYAEVLLDGGANIQVHTKPRFDRSLLCMVLHNKYNAVWERLWREGKPVLVRFMMRR